MANLFFCIVGAQKSATTTVFKWLNEHVELSLPASKEAPFFSKDELYLEGWDSCFRKNFHKASADLKCGTASPQYFGIEKVPARLRGLFPDIKLILVLRNPVDRAFSHYQMEIRANRETRAFSEAIEDLLRPEQIKASRYGDPGQVKAYVSFGEYGFLIKRWMDFFDLDQFLILTMDEIEKTPKDSMRKICTFLEVDESFTPSSLGKKFHQGGGSTWLPTTRELKNNILFKIAKIFIPNKMYSRFAFWYKIYNVKKSDGTLSMDVNTRVKLERYYAKDALLFKEMTGITLPWL